MTYLEYEVSLVGTVRENLWRRGYPGWACTYICLTTEYTELRPLLSGVHSVMRVKSVLAGEGGGCTAARPPPLITFTLTSKVAVYPPAVWADPLTLFHLYQYMYSVCLTWMYMSSL